MAQKINLLLQLGSHQAEIVLLSHSLEGVWLERLICYYNFAIIRLKFLSYLHFLRVCGIEI
jgi:hypothetical protein